MIADNLLETLANSRLIESKMQSISEIEDEIYFHLAYEKQSIFENKRVELGSVGRNLKFKVITSKTNFGNVSDIINGVNVEKINEDLLSGSVLNEQEILRLFESSLVVLTNNNVAKIGAGKLISLSKKLQKTIFIVHDFDSHHWYHMSVQSALFADAYFPAHPADHSITGRINPVLITGVPCGSIQWNYEFLMMKSSQLTKIIRSDHPLGRHFYYEKFKMRNKIIATLSNYSPDTEIQYSNFHDFSPEDRWTDWASHKLHWIVPVQNDLPLRFFDALITGGIPLVPKGMMNYIDSLGYSNYCLEYSVKDIIEPSKFISKALSHFDSMGTNGIIDRFSKAMSTSHVDKIIAQLFRRTCREFERADLFV